MAAYRPCGRRIVELDIASVPMDASGKLGRLCLHAEERRSAVARISDALRLRQTAKGAMTRRNALPVPDHTG